MLDEIFLIVAMPEFLIRTHLGLPEGYGDNWKREVYEKFKVFDDALAKRRLENIITGIFHHTETKPNNRGRFRSLDLELNQTKYGSFSEDLRHDAKGMPMDNKEFTYLIDAEFVPAPVDDVRDGLQYFQSAPDPIKSEATFEFDVKGAKIIENIINIIRHTTIFESKGRPWMVEWPQKKAIRKQNNVISTLQRYEDKREQLLNVWNKWRSAELQGYSVKSPTYDKA